jgi:predicted Zn-dependent protease
VPLLALLQSTPLTPDQVKEVVRHITAGESSATEVDRDEIAAFIHDVTHHDAAPEDIKRVAAKLAAAGWPLAGVAGEAI